MYCNMPMGEVVMHRIHKHDSLNTLAGLNQCASLKPVAHIIRHHDSHHMTYTPCRYNVPTLWLTITTRCIVSKKRDTTNVSTNDNNRQQRGWIAFTEAARCCTCSGVWTETAQTVLKCEAHSKAKLTPKLTQSEAHSLNVKLASNPCSHSPLWQLTRHWASTGGAPRE